MNAKAIAGYLNTHPDQITKVTEMAFVLVVTVKGFRPVFISKARLALFIANDAKKYNVGEFRHFVSTAYCKAYGSRPIWASPEAKANAAKRASVNFSVVQSVFAMPKR